MEIAQQSDTTAVVVAIAKDRGTLMLYNIGISKARREIYATLSVPGRLYAVDEKIKLMKRGFAI